MEDQTRNDKQVETGSEKDEKQTPKKRRKGKGPTITEIAVEARKEHLSYGQYVAKYDL